MDLIEPKIDEYLDRFTDAGHPVVAEMEELAEERKFPIVGPQVGRLLELLTLSVGARRVLELGSGFGYSAFFFARALGGGDEVVLTEYDEDNVELARDFLDRAGLGDRARIEVGDGFKLAAAMAPESFGIVFCDVDKAEYPEALEIARRLLRPGGLLIVDNMLWYGRVLDPPEDDEDTAGVVALSEALAEAQDFVTTILPVRDGVSVSVKRAAPGE